MKKFYFLALLALATLGIQAQTILDEDFETDNTEETYSTPIGTVDGWTSVNGYTGSEVKYNWHNLYYSSGSSTFNGKHCAAVDCGYLEGTKGPRQETLLSPELTLNNTYQLSFTWCVSPMAFYDNSRYDLQVRVVENGDVDNAPTIFSIQNADNLKDACGITGTPSGWTTYATKLDLSDYQGKTVKLAFVYILQKENGNGLYLDDVKVKQFTPDNGPKPSLSATSYKYGNVYIGEKFYTEVIKLTNVGKNGLTVTGVDLPAGVTINSDYTTVNLDKNDSWSFQLAYKASLTSVASGTAVIHTNGGDVSVALSATKLSVPDGMTEETFDEHFPPAGWTNSGWVKTSQALEGDVSAYASASFDDNYLTSPRLDLTKGGSVQFAYYNDFTSEDGTTYQENDITVEVSTDGGKTWITKWTFDYDNEEVQNKLITETVDLGTGTDNSYVRWHNTAVEYDSESGAGEASTFYLDRVFLPNVYGQDDVPGAATIVAPADSATAVYPKAVKLEWGPAQFATGYKLYVGTSETAFTLVGGTDLGDALTYTLTTAPYATMIYWKVVPYNAKGENLNTPVWHFTTQPDASVSEFPYSENFTGLKDIPNGWTTGNEGNGYAEGETGYSARNWTANTIYGNDAPSLANMWLNTGGTAWVATPEFKLPAGKAMSLSFDWLDIHVADGLKDDTGVRTKTNLTPNNGATKVALEINADGTWKELTYLSTAIEEQKYWLHETIDLSEYAGQTVQFRWVHYSYNQSLDRGCGVDNVLLEAIETSKAEFNKSEWAAGKVNYGKSVNSGDQFTLINRGSETLKINQVVFANSNFTTSLKAGDEIAPGKGLTFNIQFDALQTAQALTDELEVIFDGDYSATLPVSGEALAEDVRYYSFEDNTLDYQWTSDFTLIDVDNANTTPFTCYGTECPASGTRYAFTIAYERPNHANVGPCSGDAFLVTGTPESEDTKGDNWIVSPKLAINSGATFDFYARNWESNQSILPDAHHKVAVLVSETSNTDTSTFTEVLKLQEIPFLDYQNWEHYTVDLSAYAGKEVYVAVRDVNESWAQVAFFDDFTFTHVNLSATGIATIDRQISDNAQVSVYSINGVQVAQGQGLNTLQSLQKGIYVVKVQDGNQTKTLRIARK